MLRILSWEGADLKVSGHYFNLVTQAVLLFEVDTWVLTPMMERALSSFQHRVVQQLIRRHPSIREGGSWEYHSLEEAVAEAGFKGIVKYITGKQNNPISILRLELL